MSISQETTEAIESFLDRGLITEVLHVVKSGKEATVSCCRAGASLGGGLVAAKIYRPRENRNFKNDALYTEGYVILDRRARRAVLGKTDFGRKAQGMIWVNREHEALTALSLAGADVPRVHATAPGGLLIDYFGEEHAPAPLLKNADLTGLDAGELYRRIMANIELFLSNNLVHADLSPFNILVWRGDVTIIDFPQAVDPRFNPHALSLLQHDIEQVNRFFARQGVRVEEDAARSLWQRWRTGDL